MSRAARAALAEDRRRVDKLIADTGTRFQEEAAPAKPEMPPEADRVFRAHQLYAHCHAHIAERRPSLWTGEVIGATIAEQWMQNLMRKMQEAAITASMTEVEARERAAAVGLVLDPFAGSGTTGVAARQLGRRAVLIELDEGHCAEAASRLGQQTLLTPG